MRDNFVVDYNPGRSVILAHVSPIRADKPVGSLSSCIMNLWFVYRMMRLRVALRQRGVVMATVTT